MAAPQICGRSIPFISGCPPDSAQLMLWNVAGTPDGVAMMTWGQARCCWTQQVFGGGIQSFFGSQLDGSGIIELAGLTSNMELYALNVPNFLLDPSQWTLISDVDTGLPVGIQVLIGYLPEDKFLAFPNPSCVAPADPIAEFSGLNENIGGSGVDSYVVVMTNARKARFGAVLSITVYANDGSGNYFIQTVPIVPDDPDNPTMYTVFGLTGLDWRIVLT